MNTDVKRNFSFAFIAQGISLVVSCIMNLILPKIIGAEDYSYWQLFLFYLTYISFIALGINDGVYLRYGGKKSEELDYKSIKSQYVVGLIYQGIIAIIVGIGALIIIDDYKREVIVLLVLFYYMIYTAHNFLGYVFQAINQTSKYSKSIIIDKLVYLLFLIVLIFGGQVSAYIVIFVYMLAMLFALIYLLVSIKKKFKVVCIDLLYGYKEAVISIKTGISLMISNICSMMVLGVGRQIIDIRWGILAFGKVSFSLTLINFVLTFISQVSMVLFPALRRVENEELENYYLTITKTLFKVLPFMYLFYLPGQYILQLWLPEYSDSIAYLAIVLPICYFECKMKLVGTTFFKILSKQTELLKVNIATVIFACVSGIISAVIFDNMIFVIVGMVASIIFRSVLSDIILSKYMNASILKYELLDVVLAILFMFTANFFSWSISLVIVLLCIFLRWMMFYKK